MTDLFERKELWFVIVLTLLGLLFSRKFFIVFVNSLSPFIGLLLWYGFFAVFIFGILRLIGIKIGEKAVGSNFKNVAGILILTFAVLVVWNWFESPWGAIAINSDPALVPNTFYQTEDGVVWSMWDKLVNLQFPLLFWETKVLLIKDLVYVFTPFVLGLLSILIIKADDIDEVFD